jgi:eukaryotic-like serine/threonine-protein kinase
VAVDPDAIVIEPTRGPFVSGFSGARYVDRAGKNRGLPLTLGSEVAYMAPEQIEDASRADARSVVYRAGAFLYHMLAGERPFAARSNIEFFTKILNDPPRKLERPDRHPAIEAVVFRCLAKKPESRFGTPRDLAEALRGATRVPR